ncbi:DUF7601 domain-containing protein [Anaerofustis stercorihominis]|uniref:DUF7601 domain-containing protein n=1 Tax=Anaerofustis stercorihominis TaxID=214853 RepID=UPI002672BB17|nr:SpaA isopeptide-forming pilin-related protein [Anaerofustis stercorihominis]
MKLYMKKLNIRRKVFLIFLFVIASIWIPVLTVNASTPLSDDVLNQHIVKGVNPDGVKINLFDYWVETENPTKGDILSKENEAHPRQYPGPWGTTGRYSGPDNWNKGINSNHLLIFGDGVVHAGLWNKGAGENTAYGKKYAGMEGIVKSTLVDGYPVINTNAARKKLTGNKDERNWEDITEYKYAGTHQSGVTSYEDYKEEGVQNISETVINNWEKASSQTLEKGKESLDYLFDLQKNNGYKKSYENVTGLFQVDGEGYYYYNMRENFAEFEKNTSTRDDNDRSEIKSDGNFKLYDAPATVRTDAENSVGNFFPFNTGKEVFDGVNSNNELTSSVACSGNTMNHHLGMTVDVDFRQPSSGLVNQGISGKQPMTFRFSGDDDVWVYIDDVLVLDLGGVHSEIYGVIDFASGDVIIGRSFDTKGIPNYDHDNPENTSGLVTKTTLRQLFKDAGKEDSVDWSGNTCASNTNHVLKMFYLERGNYDSSIDLRFNLAPALHHQIKKVDQEGNPLKDVEFELYEASLNSKGLPIKNNNGKYEIKNGVLAHLKTDENGLAEFIEPEETDINERPFNFTDRYHNNNIKYYILKETKTPVGYRTLPVDIVLEYDYNNNMLIVNNKWATGAYASFASTIQGNSNVTYGKFDTGSGDINASDTKISLDEQENGLVVAIPMLYEQESLKWTALYGSNTKGFNKVTPEDRSALSWRFAVLIASLTQCADNDLNTPHWYLEWDELTDRLNGNLFDLPGRADRYQLNNAKGDMKMVYAIINSSVFEKLNIKAKSSKERYDELGKYIRYQLNNGKTINDIAKEVYQIPSNGQVYDQDNGYDQRGFSLMNVDQFTRRFSSLIYIPNEQRELRVWKVDQNGIAVNGAEFQLVRMDNDKVAASGITGNVDGKDGVLIFKPSVPMKDDATVKEGYAKIEWARTSCDRYYLKEVKAPKGYEVNNKKIPVVVGIYSIYADAGSSDDGITVMAGVGKLTQNMVKYASDETVNITLRDITAYAQYQKSGKFDINGWKDIILEDTDNINQSMNLHYDMNAVISYGLHDEDGGKNFYPFFVTDKGFIRTRVKQNYQALVKPFYGNTVNNSANKEKIDEDITGLFSLINIVVVTDKNDKDVEKGKLKVSKRVIGKNLTENDYKRYFEFTLELKDPFGKDLPGDYYFFGTDKSGYIRSGDKLILHHDESITILGIPKGTKYKVTEKAVNNWYAIPGEVQQGIINENTTCAADFINTNTLVTHIKGSKIWKDNNNKNNIRPNSIKIHIKDGSNIVETIILKSAKDGVWDESDLVFESKPLPKYKDGKEINYYIEEAGVDGYKTNITGDVDKGFVIINTLKDKVKSPGRSNISNPSDVKRNLTSNPETKDISNIEQWMFTFVVSIIILLLIVLYLKNDRKI